MYFFLLQSVIAAPAKLTINNNCGFDVKPFFQGGQPQNKMAAGGKLTLNAPFAGSRMYFGPEDWIEKAGNKEFLGFLEFNSAGDNINLNPSMIDYFGLPMEFVHMGKGGQVIKRSGCDS